MLELDEIRKTLTPHPPYTDAERDIVYRALACMAAILAEAGVPVIIDATAHPGAWRELARAAIPRFAEVQLLLPARRLPRARAHPAARPRAGGASTRAPDSRAPPCRAWTCRTSPRSRPSW